MIQRVKKVYLSPETFGEASRTRARVIGDVFVTENVVRPVPAKTEKQQPRKRTALDVHASR